MEYIRQAVEQIVKENETRDPFRLAKLMGIDVDEYPFRSVKGMVVEIAGRITVILNSTLPKWLKMVVLAHELGHLLLSPAGVGYFFLADHTLMEDQVEYDANRFAMELLVGEQVPKLNESLEHFAARVKVPVEMLRCRVIQEDK